MFVCSRAVWAGRALTAAKPNAMSGRLFITSAIALALCACSLIRAQSPTQLASGNVDGVVTGPSGPIAGAAVTITPGDNSFHSASTDAAGYFSVSGVLVGPATLQAAAVSYRSYTGSITIQPDATLTVNVSLTPL